MQAHRLLRSAVALLGLAALARAQVVEDFEDNVNQAGWTFGNTIEAIEDGGNPGKHLHNSHIDTFAPQLRTTSPSSPYNGDYRAQGYTSFEVDLLTYSTQFPAQRELSLILSSGVCSVYYKGTATVPQPGSGWKSFQFDIDSASTTLPPGWAVLNGCGSDDVTWNIVITGVTEVRFFYGDPTFFFIFDIWDVGMDNAILGFGLATPFCSGDGSAAPCPCGNSGGPGAGCANSTGVGGELGVGGSDSVASDDLSFSASSLPPHQSALLFAGSASVNGGSGAPFGDGLRCAGGSVVRLGVVSSSAQGAASWGPGLGSIGGWGAGDTRYFQAWYRDSVGSICGSGFNLTQGMAVTFTP